ncbi:MAG: flagellar biosynthetic protein FliO [Methylophilaceae bacterium]
MQKRLALIFLVCLGNYSVAFAATGATGISPTASVLKMLLGLAAVLAVMAAVSWVVKRMLPGGAGAQSAVRIVGGVSVGSREKVVVLQVADRWLVVGVAPGQVNSIANLDIGATQVADQLTQNLATSNQTLHPMMQPLVKSFSELLKKSTEKIKKTQ